MARQAHPAPGSDSAARRNLFALGLVALALALLAGGGALLAGFGNRMEWWHYRTAFTVLRWCGYTAMVAGLLSVLGIIGAVAFGSSRILIALVPALAIASSTAGLPLLQLNKARAVPPIHDISTDLENPPVFVAVLPRRAGAPNPAAYGGAAIAEQQRRAYPDIVPRRYALAPEELFRVALAAARGMGWEIVATDPAEGRIEATATTFWFGFKDDVVVRIGAVEGGSRLDVRSVSRVGRSDVGANAARIRAFLAALPPPLPRQ